ncbi:MULTISPECIES: xanthine dehydrogenase family protein molybdopterin-binding subunit [Agrobacterium]|uniref:xanthine dehydrogenase family protein molybdopterin-binding subunit n=1 Tax=Agrobacterium TaxID=357 RepID=UPI00054D6C26|nr:MULTISPECIES: xanthine dehydrogenase family protein molybdopterin-binding subunit [Agrobacterium]AUC12035.1 dehydrogenase [Rhizobium sp. Y9]MBP2611637.1 xanthine dehydrogenase YagR molybdenum-binding subunit [Agrobacterium pusense]MCZ7927043.1 xanthine dehydrogenase family protein molybdopterin-binding subunit [Agrobacterium pusense]PTV68878.1 xanthine dehydrogenase family protein molybdopterin-binding subunit [Agrobacterium pusense]QBJ15307.1 xanthine dehydrogenase family protein molybdopt
MSADTHTLPEAGRQGRWQPAVTKDPLLRKHGALGQSISRIEGPMKVQGRTRFAAEFPYDNISYAALAFSTVARGRISELNVSAAEAAPGVILVMTYRNAPRMKAPSLMMSSPTAAGASNLPVMQNDEIHWNGQPIALVLAETQEQADYAASLVTAKYELLPAVTSFDEAKKSPRQLENLLGQPPFVEIGDAEAALASSQVKVDLIYRTPRHNHNAIELHAATIVWNDDELRVHDASQLLDLTTGQLADIFGLDISKVHVTSPYVGGGFGGKCFWDHQILACAAAKLAGRPVRIMLSREGVFRIIGGRTVTEQRVALGARTDGTLNALIHTGTAAMTTHNSCPEQFTFPARHLYGARTFRIGQDVADLDMLANTFMRAPGESVGTFALECALDELAEKLELDPIELRRRIEPEKDPTTGKPFSSRFLIEAYDKGAEQFGWDKRSRTPRQRREGEWLIGMGCATATYPYHRFPGGAARIKLTADGHVTVSTAVHDMGMGTATAQVQHLAARLGLPLEHVTFEYGDSRLPRGVIAGGSTQTASIGGAIIAATEVFMEELIKLAGNDSPLAGLSLSEVEARDGGLSHVSDSSRFESYQSILQRAGREELVCEAEAPAPAEMEAFSMHSYGAQFCEVRVSALTGETRVSRFLGSFDAGQILNPKMATSQFKGGIIMGIGLALTEETYFDERTGRIVNASLADYHVPVQMDVPPIEILYTNKPDPQAPMGARGIGEIGITGVGAAVANAVYNATGIRVRDLPVTLDKLMAGLD